ncbi:Alpha-ketoglutarate-dependent taurine dioxygenase [Cupriavidus taiwanensis]|uniref:TauD/TfdA dioxygenase family protein n=1 Tax=Cupriavidus taiwanensis TaxID=164546 RepID=UPI000E18E428|nr:TauD/TfdA family dioxygenase [Cupriavidus taiwanensis]SPA39627.1 Alpha-ketoglutarate-dependent taurine dioxygenase [Cupriavidus taiwanensis]
MQATAGRPAHAATPVPATDDWPFTVTRCTPTIGAEIEGIDLGQPLHDDTYQALRRALLKYKVLFFRDQDITPAQHVAAARRFGELELHPMIPCHPDHPELVVFGHDGQSRGRENLYHSDVSWRAVPSMGSMLRCLACPDVGGDTIWVNMVAAYEALPQEIKDLIGQLHAVHDAMPTFGQAITGSRYDEMRAKYPPMVHPVVRTHPETREKILFVNEGFTTHLANYVRVRPYRIGSDGRMAEMDLLHYLFRQAAAPEYQVRLKWRPNTVALWDNRSTQHYAISDYHPAVRHMNRATIIGDKPV